MDFSISFNSENDLCQGKPKKWSILLTVAMPISALNYVNKCLWLQMARIKMAQLQLEKFRLNFSSCFRASSKKIDFSGSSLFSLCELRLYLPFRYSKIVLRMG